MELEKEVKNRTTSTDEEAKPFYSQNSAIPEEMYVGMGLSSSLNSKISATLRLAELLYLNAWSLQNFINCFN